MAHTNEQQQVLYKWLTEARKHLGYVVEGKKNTATLQSVYSNLEDLRFGLERCDTEQSKRMVETVNGIRSKVLSVYQGENGPSYLIGSLYLIDDMLILIGTQSGILTNIPDGIIAGCQPNDADSVDKVYLIAMKLASMAKDSENMQLNDLADELFDLVEHISPKD